MALGKRLQRHRFDPETIKQVRALYGLDNWHGPLALASDYIVIGLAILACVQFGWIAYPFAVIIIGSRQRALATITHEASHRTLMTNTKLNDILGKYMSGYLIGVLFNAYQESHVKSHHGHFGHEEEDADYKYMRDMGVYEDCSQAQYTWNILIRPLLFLRLPSYLGFLLRDRLLAIRSDEGRREAINMAVFWAGLLALIVYLGVAWEFVLYWVIPFLTAFQIIGWYIELSEHAPMMGVGLDIHMSRNRNSHWLEHALTGVHGECYHLAHHLWARVPFWKLKQLNEILRQDRAYREHDDRCGGIVFSNNGAPSVVSLLGRIKQKPGIITEPDLNRA